MIFDDTGDGAGMGADAVSPADIEHDEHSVFLDADTVIVQTRMGRRGPELNLRPDVPAGLGRLRQVTDNIIVLVEPARGAGSALVPDQERVDFLREALGGEADDLLIATCPHQPEDACACAKPGTGLIEVAVEAHQLDARTGWHIGGDQPGVMAGRGAGLRTIRIGPLAEDPMSGIHRPDHQSRDLLDAANHILMESLSRPSAVSS